MKHAYNMQRISFGNKLARTLWQVVWLLFYRPTPRLFHPWRCFLLRLFGAKLGKAVHPYPSARIWAPWNLEMGDHACLSEYVDCYCVAKLVSVPCRQSVSTVFFVVRVMITQWLRCRWSQRPLQSVRRHGLQPMYSSDRV